MLDWLTNISVRTILIIVGSLLSVRVLTLRAAFLSRPVRRQMAEIAETFAVALVMVFLVVHRFVFQLFFIPSESMVPTLQVHDRIVVNRFLYRFRPPQRKDIIVFRAPKKASAEPKDFVKRLIGLPGETIAVVPDEVQIDGRPLFPIINRDEDGPEQPSLALRVDPTSRVEVDGGRLLVDGQCVLALSAAGKSAISGRDLFIDGVNVHRFSAGDSERPTLLPAMLRGAGKFTGEAFYQPDGTPFPVLQGAKLSVEPGYVEINGKRLTGEDYVAQTPRYRLPPTHLGEHDYFVLGDNRNLSLDSHRWGTLRASAIIGKAWAMFWPIPRAGLVN
jgi:signal peptidase I